MTVKSVWGRIQRQGAVLLEKDGGKWVFQVPSWATSPLIVEFWAEDDAGNITYRTGIFTLEKGQTKCIRWLKEGSDAIMLPDHRPIAEALEDRPIAEWMDVGLNIEILAEDRPRMEMLDHACSRLIEVSI